MWDLVMYICLEFMKMFMEVVGIVFDRFVLVKIIFVDLLFNLNDVCFRFVVVCVVILCVVVGELVNEILIIFLCFISGILVFLLYFNIVL